MCSNNCRDPIYIYYIIVYNIVTTAVAVRAEIVIAAAAGAVVDGFQSKRFRVRVQLRAGRDDLGSTGKRFFCLLMPTSGCYLHAKGSYKGRLEINEQSSGVRECVCNKIKRQSYSIFASTTHTHTHTFYFIVIYTLIQ